MNRFKKELRKRGYKLEMDYPYLPYQIKEGSVVTIETVVVNSEKCILSEWFNVVGWCRTSFNRKFEPVVDEYI